VADELLAPNYVSRD
jgi:predicted ester cyclase